MIRRMNDKIILMSLMNKIISIKYLVFNSILGSIGLTLLASPPFILDFLTTRVALSICSGTLDHSLYTCAGSKDYCPNSISTKNSFLIVLELNFYSIYGERVK